MKFEGFERGMGVGGWLTNYKRFHVIDKSKVNVLTVGDSEHFRTYITEWDVKNIAHMGFDHVRVCFDQVVLQNEEGEFIEAHFDLLDRFAAWCEKYGLNTVFNLHKAIGNYCDVDTGVSLFESKPLQDGFVALWKRIEERMGAHPYVAFELLNEVKDVDRSVWNGLVKRTVAAIRSVNATRRIIVGSVCWNSPNTLCDLELSDDENIAYTFHFYDPFEFTHQQGVLQAPTAFYNRAMPYPCDIERYRDYQRTVYGNEKAYPQFERMDKSYLLYALRGALAFRKEHPEKVLWCGEFGTIRHCKEEWRIAWMRDVISILQEYGIPYSVWNYLSAPYDGNRFSLMDDETRKPLSKQLLKVLLGKI